MMWLMCLILLDSVRSGSMRSTVLGCGRNCSSRTPSRAILICPWGCGVTVAYETRSCTTHCSGQVVVCGNQLQGHDVDVDVNVYVNVNVHSHGTNSVRGAFVLHTLYSVRSRYTKMCSCEIVQPLIQRDTSNPNLHLDTVYSTPCILSDPRYPSMAFDSMDKQTINSTVV